MSIYKHNCTYYIITCREYVKNKLCNYFHNNKSMEVFISCCDNRKLKICTYK